MSFTPLKDILPKTANVKHNVAHALCMNDADIFEIFARILLEEVGPIVAEKIHPLFVRNAALVVACFYRATAEILALKEKDIIGRMNEELNVRNIRGLRIVK